MAQRVGINRWIDVIADKSRLQQLGLAATAVIVALVLAWQFILSHSVGELASLREDLATTNALITSKQIVASRLDRVTKRSSQAANTLQGALEALRSQAQVDSLLEQISGVASEIGLDLKLFQRKDEKLAIFYAEVPTYVVVTGGFHAVSEFIDRVSRLPGLVSLKQLNLSNVNRISSGGGIQAEFTVMTYRALSANR